MHGQPAFGYVEYIVEEHTRKELIAQKKNHCTRNNLVSVHTVVIYQPYLLLMYMQLNHQQCSMHSQVLTDVHNHWHTFFVWCTVCINHNALVICTNHIIQFVNRHAKWLDKGHAWIKIICQIPSQKMGGGNCLCYTWIFIWCLLYTQCMSIERATIILVTKKLWLGQEVWPLVHIRWPSSSIWPCIHYRACGYESDCLQHHCT